MKAKDLIKLLERNPDLDVGIFNPVLNEFYSVKNVDVQYGLQGETQWLQLEFNNV